MSIRPWAAQATTKDKEQYNTTCSHINLIWEGADGASAVLVGGSLAADRADELRAWSITHKMCVFGVDSDNLIEKYITPIPRQDLCTHTHTFRRPYFGILRQFIGQHEEARLYLKRFLGELLLVLVRRILEGAFPDTFWRPDFKTRSRGQVPTHFVTSTRFRHVSGFQDTIGDDISSIMGAHFKTPRHFTIRRKEYPDAQDDLYICRQEVPGVQDMDFSWNYHKSRQMHEPTVRALQSITDLVLGASLAIPWRVLLYCKQGTSRSASMAAGWLTCRHMRACRSCTYVDAQRCLREALSDYHYDIMIMIQNLSLR